MYLQPGVLEDVFGSATYQRGHRYYLQGRVSELSDTRSGTSLHHIHAAVSGSGRQSYRTVVTVDTMTPWALNAVCSCPVGVFCKHAVAVLLTANERADPRVKPTLSRDEQLGIHFQQWLREFRELKEAASRDIGLVFVLNADSVSGNVYVSCRRIRVLKSGRLGKSQEVSPWQRHDLEQQPPKYIQKPDIEPLLWIQRLPGSHRSSPVVSGMAGARFLASALETGRLVWEKPDSCPFSRGEPLSVELQWQQDEAGNFMLTPSSMGDLMILPTDPPWYLDAENHKAGPLNLPVDTDTWLLLLDAPPIPPALLEEHSTELRPLMEASGTSLPESIRVPEEVHDTPVPVLQLFQIPGPQSSPLKVARLRFDYRGVLLEEYESSGDNPVQRIDDDQSLLIFRDIPLERQCSGELVDFLFLFELDETWARSLPGGMDHDQTLPTPSLWLDFLAWELPRLAGAGWRIEMDDSMDVPVVEASDWYGRTDTSEEPGWFDVELGIEQDGERIDLIPLLEKGLQHLDIGLSLDEDGHLELPESLWLHDGESLIRVPSDRVRPMLETLVHLFHRGFSATMDDGPLSLPRLDAAMLAGTSAAQWESGDQLRKLGQQLADFTGLETVAPPEGLNATLRHYQQDGLNWLHFLRQSELGGVLADDMGLGKTLQTLACILVEKQAGRLQQPALVVCPTSVIPNWKAEAARFTPDLRLLVIHGPKRRQLFDNRGEADLVITSYPLLHRDASHHEALAYSMVFFDEAQNLKNPKAAVSKAARRLTTTNRIALTGTPMENHLGELWSLFDLVLPGYLGTGAEFREFYRNPIERNGDQDQHYHLGRRIRPFLLRRTKDQVTPELPEKTEMVKLVELNSVQKDLYETVRASMNAKIRQLMNEKGVARSQIEILEALLKLRQICCHPDLLKSSDQPLASAKLNYLLGMITELLEEGRRIIIFSQFTSMLAILEKALASMRLDYVKLTGKTRNREKPVKDFQAGKVPLFLISLKAGGAGLNLTAADCVIHYDPWWNPAVEQQATDRAWRIGQDKPVFVYRLICEGTVEERIQALQQRKAQLADGLYGKAENFSAALTAEDVQVLFQPLGRG
ncbi:DEAD/DEAH box helicase [Marinobacter zhanjiangensis]|uniref:DEAD/DEAH box helicase n=1 Tax=Marinobacter zhanjiangensis TaxID=578215 RepID=A0ABQ3B6R2_9GAMM|nr:DEAD/DEAH box helicase [Marinobacter zhanjiangensis]GGY76224.1 DEAD/DEAH box helicase [Marinobacter zhanjiangensis]